MAAMFYSRTRKYALTQVTLTWWDCVFLIPAGSMALFWFHMIPRLQDMPSDC